MKIKIMTFLLILVVGLSCLGVESDVAYAYTDADIVSYESKFSQLSVDSSGSYTREIFLDIVCPTYETTSSTVFHSDSPIYHVSLRQYSSDLSAFYSVDFVFSESMIRRSTHTDGGSTHYPGNCYVDKAVFSDGRELYIAEVICQSIGYKTVSISYNVEPDYICYVDYVDSELDNSFYKFISTEVYPPKIVNYNPDLGYLKNVTQKMISLNAPEGGIDYTSAQLKISFDGLSTTDVDLSTGEYKVRLYEQGCYYNNGIVSVYKEDYPLIEIGDYSIVDNSITFSVAEAFEKCTNETEGWLSSWDMFWIHCERSDNLYLQIIKTGSDGSEEYGGLVKLAYPVDSNGQIYSSTYFPDLTPDQDGYTGDKVDSGSGSGTNYEDAELNADQDLENNINNPNFSGDITNDMNSLISFIGAVPQLLAALLGFLPQHYKSLIYASIALALVLVVVKR